MFVQVSVLCCVQAPRISVVGHTVPRATTALRFRSVQNIYGLWCNDTDFARSCELVRRWRIANRSGMALARSDPISILLVQLPNMPVLLEIEGMFDHIKLADLRPEWTGEFADTMEEQSVGNNASKQRDRKGTGARYYIEKCSEDSVLPARADAQRSESHERGCTDIENCNCALVLVAACKIEVRYEACQACQAD